MFLLIINNHGSMCSLVDIGERFSRRKVVPENLIFRYLTPIFKQVHSIAFEHEGSYKEARYSIRLRGYGTDPSPSILPEDDLQELLKYGAEGTLKHLWNMHKSQRFFPPYTNVILVVDVTQPLTDELKVCMNTREANKIFESILSALRLHMSSGLAYEYTYIFRAPPIRSTSTDGLPEIIKKLSEESLDCTITWPHSIPFVFSPFGSGLSVMQNNHYADCIDTFNVLVNKEWNDSQTFDNVLGLALEYHKISLNLEKPEHGFLVLMMIFEALFKKASEDNSDPAANRISKFLSVVKSDHQEIQKAFYDTAEDTFCKLRNKTAHGDPTIDHIIVKSKYPILYQYIKNAIIKLISIPNNRVDHTKDYYEEVGAFIEKQFLALPNS